MAARSVKPTGKQPPPSKSAPSWGAIAMLVLAMPLLFGVGSLIGFGMRPAGFFPHGEGEANVELGASAHLGSTVSALPKAPRTSSSLRAAILPIPSASVATADLMIRMDTHLTILNGTKRAGLGNEAANLLREEGWTVWIVGNAPRSDLTETQIAIVHGDPMLVTPLMHALKVPGIQADRSLGDTSSDFTILLGEDFTDALRQARLMPTGI